MKGYLFKRLREQVESGKVSTALLLNSLAEQVMELARCQDEAASKTSDSEAAKVFTASVLVLEKLASNLELHALSHAGEAPTELSAEDRVKVIER